MKVLVTGSSGFSGSYIAGYLASQGYHVILPSRSGNFKLFDTWDIHHSQCTKIVAELGDLSSSNLDVDIIIHAAATSDWIGVSNDKIKKDNIAGTKDLLDFAISSNIKHFIFLSSFSVFGNICSQFLNEQTPIFDPGTYGNSKLICENYLQSQNSFSCTIFRLPAVIGKGSKRNWPSEFLKKIKSEPSVSYFNPNSLFNNIIHIQDLATVISNVINFNIFNNNVFVVGSRLPVTIGECVKIMKLASGSVSTLISHEKQHPTFLVDFTKAEKAIQYNPMSVTQALEKFVIENEY